MQHRSCPTGSTSIAEWALPPSEYMNHPKRTMYDYLPERSMKSYGIPASGFFFTCFQISICNLVRHLEFELHCYRQILTYFTVRNRPSCIHGLVNYMDLQTFAHTYIKCVSRPISISVMVGKCFTLWWTNTLEGGISGQSSWGSLHQRIF